jgi:hypothetical protein
MAKIQRGENKKTVFIAKAGSTELYLFALRDFETKADALGMTFRDKVVNLQSILAFSYQATYQQAIIGLPAAGPIDQAQYDAVKETIASAICTNTDRSSLIEYICTDCRHAPASMSAREFFIRLDILVQYASMMPGPDVLPTEDDKNKKTFFGCQHPDDQAAFIQDAKKLPAAATREELIISWRSDPLFDRASRRPTIITETTPATVETTATVTAMAVIVTTIEAAVITVSATVIRTSVPSIQRPTILG